MKVVLKTNDLVRMNFAEVLLRDAQIAAFRFDDQMSMTEGSIGILPRRLMVADEDFTQAEDVLREGLASMPAEA